MCIKVILGFLAFYALILILFAISLSSCSCIQKKTNCTQDILKKKLKVFIFKILIITLAILVGIYLILLLLDYPSHKFTNMDIISLAVGIASFVAACAIAFFQKNFAEKQDEESSILQKTYNDNLLKIRCINFIYDNGFINDVFIQRSDNKYYIIISYNMPPVLKKDCFPKFDSVEIENEGVPLINNDINEKINNRIAIEINVNESCYSNWFLPFLVSKRNENNEKLSLNITLHFNLELSKDNKIYIAIKTTLFNTGEYINYSLFPAIAVRQQYVVLE